MTTALNKNRDFTRFASCARVAGLIKILSPVARRALTDGAVSVFSDGSNFTGDFKPTVKEEMNLTRGEIFRGKFLTRKNQNNKYHLEERTPAAPNS